MSVASSSIQKAAFIWLLAQQVRTLRRIIGWIRQLLKTAFSWEFLASVTSLPQYVCVLYLHDVRVTHSLVSCLYNACISKNLFNELY